MASQRFGHVIAVGTLTEISLVKQALSECVNIKNPPLQDRLARDYTIEFHSPAEFIANKYFVPGTTDAAEGYVVSFNKLWVNKKIAARRPRRARHIVRHELFHPFPLSAAKKVELMALMWRKDGTHPTEWRSGGYLGRPEECHADTCAEAASNVDSPWDDFVFFRLDVKDADLPKFLEITLRSDPVTVPPEPLPPPLPPVDPEKEMLRDQNKQLTDQNKQLTEERDSARADLETADRRIEAKDAKMQEGLAI